MAIPTFWETRSGNFRNHSLVSVVETVIIIIGSGDKQPFAFRGRFDVSRRRDVHYSKKESYHYRNGYRDLELKSRNGYGSCSAAVEAVGGQGRGFVGRAREWEVGELSGRARSHDAFPYESSAGDNEIARSQDGVSMHPEKKRKLTPIIWDRDDKEVGISSKNRISSKSPFLCSPLSLQKLMNISADGDVIMYAITNTQLQGMQMAAGAAGNSESLPNSPSLLSPKQCRRTNKELGEVEDNECIEVRHISTSQWALMDNSPGEICSDNTGDTLLNTHESEEFRREGSDSSRGKSSSFDGQDSFMELATSRHDYSENDTMEIDEKHDEVRHLDWDLEEEEEFSRFEELAAPKSRSMNMLQGCRSVFNYERLNKINEGTYGVVYKARDKETEEIVALKKVKMTLEREGFPLTSLREINILVSLHHPSIVDVKEVVVDKDVFMVMEYVEHDLKGLIDIMKQPFSEKEVKCLILQLLEGVKYLHDNWVLHRDLKTSNLLLNNRGKLKICDFGLSRQYGSPLITYTPLVVTLWYRAPELLLGTKHYSTAIDMWSVGCIMAELLAKQPLFNGKSELEQLDKIFRALGTPNEAIWPGFSKLPGAKVKFVEQSRNTLREKFPAISFKGSPVLSEQGFDLLSQLLTYDPEKRITAEAALKHSWFHKEEPSIQELIRNRLK
ncbi:unnamed protein product [Camellia sinensis]